MNPSNWMVVDCGSDDITDLARPPIHCFTSVYAEPSEGEISDAVVSLLGPPRRAPGDWLRESRVLLIPLDGARDLGTMRGSVSYRVVRNFPSEKAGPPPPPVRKEGVKL